MGAGATIGLGDCLIAVDRALAEWALPASQTKGMTVDDMTRRLQKLFPGKYKNGFLWTWTQDSVALLASYGIESKTFAGATFSQLQSWVRRGPVMVTVDYKLLPYANRYDKAYDNAHAICLWKVGDHDIEYGDPYGRDPKYGRMTIAVPKFIPAWESTRFYERPRQGLRLLEGV